MQIGSEHVALCFSIRMRRRGASDFGLYIEGPVGSWVGRGVLCIREGQSFCLNFWIWHRSHLLSEGETYTRRRIFSVILNGTCMKLSRRRGYDCSTWLLGPKYHLAVAGLCKGRARDVALIGYVRSDAMARQELQNPNDLLQYWSPHKTMIHSAVIMWQHSLSFFFWMRWQRSHQAMQNIRLVQIK